MAAAGIYTMGGAFWEFGAPDWERTKLFLLFGVAEDHDSNPIKIGLGKLKERGAKIIGVNPVRTGYNAVADEWIGITPGHRRAPRPRLVHVPAGAPAGSTSTTSSATPTRRCLVIDDPGHAEHGLFLRDGEDGARWSSTAGPAGPLPATAWAAKPDLRGDDAPPTTAGPPARLRADRRALPRPRLRARSGRRRTAASPRRRIRRTRGRTRARSPSTAEHRHRPALDRLARRAARDDDRPPGRYARHARHLGPFQRLPDLPRDPPPADPARLGRDAGRLPLQAALSEAGRRRIRGRMRVPRRASRSTGPHLGFPLGPEDLCRSTTTARPLRIDKAFSWEAPMSAHGLMHMVISNAAAGDPYQIDVLFLYMANMAWNSSMNTAGVMEMLTDKDENGEYVIPQDHLLRRLLLRDGRLCRSDPAGHDLSRAARLHLAPRPADLRARLRGRRDPLAGGGARPRRARLPVGAPRPRRPARAAGLREPDGKPSLPRLRRLHDPPPAPPRRRAARRLARQRRGPGDGARPTPTRSTATSRMAASAQAHVPEEAALLQAVERAPTRTGPCRWASTTSPQPYLFQLYVRAAPALPARRGRARDAAAARAPPRAHPRELRPAADLVSAVRGRGHRRQGISLPRDHPAADGDVPFVAFPERLAPADPRREPALRSGGSLPMRPGSRMATGPG